MESFSLSNDVLNKALQLLKKYSLCDSCLGRCFAKLGTGLTNAERGKAIKISLILQLDYLIKEHKIKDLNEVKEILLNMKETAEEFYKLYFTDEDFKSRECYICADQLDELKNDFLKKSLEVLKSGKTKSYILGVKLSDYLKMKENKFVEENNLIYYESIKNEIKREVGKKLASLGFPPEMDNPEMEVLYDISSRTVITEAQHKYYLYFFNRIRRNVPLVNWYSKDGKSLENAIQVMPTTYFSEPSEVRIFDEYYILLKDYDKDYVDLPIGYVMKKGGVVSKKEREALLQIKPSSRTYRVVVYSPQNEPAGGNKLAGNFYELIISAKNYAELKEKLKDYQVLAIDLIDSRGKHKNVVSIYLKSDQNA